MSTDHDPLHEETVVPLAPEPKAQGRGYFFYIAAFFILIALLCYLLNNTDVNWSQLTPPNPAAAPAGSK